MSHMHKLVKARHSFQSGLLAFIHGDRQESCLRMHAALAPVLAMDDHPEFVIKASALIEAVYAGALDDHAEYAKRALPLIDKQLRHLIISGDLDQRNLDLLSDAVQITRTFDTLPPMDHCSSASDVLFEFGEFWNDGGFESGGKTIAELSGIRDKFAAYASLAPAAESLLAYAEGFYGGSAEQDPLDAIDFSLDAKEVDADSATPLDEIEKFRMNVAAGVLLMQDYCATPSRLAAKTMISFMRSLPDGGDEFTVLNQALVWRGAWARVSGHASQVLKDASAAIDSFDNEGAQRLYMQVHTIVTPHLHVGAASATVTQDDVSALMERIREDAPLDVGQSESAIKDFMSGFAAPGAVNDYIIRESVGSESAVLDAQSERLGDDHKVFTAEPRVECVYDAAAPSSADKDAAPAVLSGIDLSDIDFSVSDFGDEKKTTESEVIHADAVDDADAIDPEMLSTFIEEAREVLQSIAASVRACRVCLSGGGDYKPDLADIRRGVHTLKGSGRMVGQKDLGEVAWAVEHALNTIIEDDRMIDEVLMGFIEDFSVRFGGWIDTLEWQGETIVEAQDIIDKAKTLECHSSEIETAQQNEAEVVIGDIHISSPLFNIAKNEMRNHVRSMVEQASALNVGEGNVVDPKFIRGAHTLAGVSRTSGVNVIGDLAGALEIWLLARQSSAFALSAETMNLVLQVISALDTQVHAFSQKEIPQGQPELIEKLGTTESVALDALIESQEVIDLTNDILTGDESEVVQEFLADDIDEDLLPVFIEEAANLESEIMGALRALSGDLANSDISALLTRLLHTMKGSARMVGAMRIGEIAHRLEDELRLFERASDKQSVADDVAAGFDEILSLIDGLTNRGQHAHQDGMSVQPSAILVQNQLKVSSIHLDSLLNESGELGAARQRIESELFRFESGLVDMDKGVAALKKYLRDIDIHAESQMQSRITTADDHFDPLEFDRFTRLQEITRFMSESIYDVQTVQQGLLSNIGEAQTSLTSQQKIMREHHQALMSVRMIPLMSIADRLYRTVRQASKDLDKRVNLDIVGGDQDVDAGILEKMTAPIEHIIRNSIVHGIEADRAAASKEATGEIKVDLKIENGELVLSISDDGAGIDVARLHQKAIAIGAVDQGARLSPDEMVNLIFLPGLSAANELTEVAGRGVGMDIVKTTIDSLGGSIAISTRTGGGTKFICHLPTSVTMMHVMMVHSGEESYAIPSSIIRHILQVNPSDMTRVMNESLIKWNGRDYILHSISQILESGSGSVTRDESMPTQFLLLEFDGAYVALQVDAVTQQRDVAVKTVGVQFKGFDGIQGAIIEGSGAVVLIVNPIQLIDNKQKSTFVTTKIVNPIRVRPLVMVVDDSLTVRKVSQKFLEAHGYDVTTATDGQDALTKLDDVDPDVMLLDIEMPRMNGFELAESLRMTDRFKNLPIAMITSRTADKHREHAMSLGVNHYMGKPFKEAVLLEVLGGYRIAMNQSGADVVNQQMESEYA